MDLQFLEDGRPHCACLSCSPSVEAKGRFYVELLEALQRGVHFHGDDFFVFGRLSSQVFVLLRFCPFLAACRIFISEPANAAHNTVQRHVL